jgi:hypothetical protein
MKRTLLLDSALLLCLAAALIWPLFRLEYLDNWPSIESTFIADARMLRENLPRPGWQPLWYCGTRFDYIYPPALRYGTALISRAANVSTARAYHIYIAIYYIFGIAAVYWMVRAGTGARYPALLAAVATALVSPSFVFLKLIRHDSPYWVPQRLHVLMAYGEGPHISAVCILPAVLAAAFLSLRKWRPAMMALAGVLAALTVANNFYGATALAIFFPILAWAVWVGERDWRVWARAAAIAALAYALCAFWLTPSYVRVTLTDLQWVAQPGNTASLFGALIFVALFCAATFKFGYGRREREWTLFVAGAAAFLTLDVVGYDFGFRVAGNTVRLVPELDLALILLFAEAIRALGNRPRWRIPAVLLALAFLSPSVRYLRHAWSPFPKAAPLDGVYEYQIAKWTHDHLPGERTLPSGSVRFWFDTWSDNQQTDGGSLQGMLNQIIPVATWQIFQGDRPELATLWMQSLGTDAAIVPDKTSPERYHDYQKPEKFRGVLPQLYNDGRGTIVYRIPRVHPGIGRVVDLQAISAIGPIRGGDDEDRLGRYVAVVENGSQPAVNVDWRGFDELRLHASTGSGQGVLVQETYDPAWRAFDRGRELPIRREPVMGFMLLDSPPGNHEIRMIFTVPMEDRAGQVLFVIALLSIGALLVSAHQSKKSTAVRRPVEAL